MPRIWAPGMPRETRFIPTQSGSTVPQARRSEIEAHFGIVRNLAHYGFRVDDLSAQLRGASRFWQLRGEAGSLLNFRNRKLAGCIGRLSG